MGISSKIAEECYSWNKEWLYNHEKNSNLFPAISMFSGEVYRSFDYATLTPKQLALANDRILILSGLYGVLRPLDLVSPYRLEMKTIGRKKIVLLSINFGQIVQAIFLKKVPLL